MQINTLYFCTLLDSFHVMNLSGNFLVKKQLFNFFYHFLMSIFSFNSSLCFPYLMALTMTCNQNIQYASTHFLKQGLSFSTPILVFLLFGIELFLSISSSAIILIIWYIMGNAIKNCLIFSSCCEMKASNYLTNRSICSVFGLNNAI